MHYEILSCPLLASIRQHYAKLKRIFKHLITDEYGENYIYNTNLSLVSMGLERSHELPIGKFIYTI